MYCDISEAESADNRKMFQGHLYLCMPGWPCPGICIGALILNQRLTICQVSELENVCHPIPLSSWSGSVSNGCLYQSQGGESFNLNYDNVFWSMGNGHVLWTMGNGYVFRLIDMYFEQWTFFNRLPRLPTHLRTPRYVLTSWSCLNTILAHLRSSQRFLSSLNSSSLAMAERWAYLLFW